MTAVLARLNPAALVTLADCEQRIERALKSFFELGQALGQIRDSRLYRATHETFEAYCQERWDIGRDYADRMIVGAQVVLTIVSTGLPAPTKEAQARELARVPEPERADVWREAVERTDGKPTAAAVREVHEERTRPTPTPGPVDTTTSPADPGTTPECLGVDMDCGRPLPCPDHPAIPGTTPAPAVPSTPPAPREPAPREGGAAAAPDPAVALVDAALAQFVPDPDAPKRAWAKRFYELTRAPHTFLLWLKAEDVAAYADEEDLTTLRHLATGFADAYQRALDARNANVTPLRRIK